ncbi:MAG: TonB family protein [Bdellovibrionales bacterium]
MTLAARVFSPKSGLGSIFYSVGVHAIIAASVIYGLRFQLAPSAPVEEYVDMDYEVLEAPPQAAPPKVVETRTEELQDQKSEVVGTQEKKEEKGEGTQVQNTPQPTLPYYKIKPKYPRAALLSGTEGWVMLVIDVNEKGEVENIRVVDGEQRNMFQSEARRAVEQWKYRPFVDGEGHPVRKVDHQVRVDFRLTDEEEAGS